MNVTKFENYPFKSVLVSNLVSLTIYALGFFIILKSGLILSLLYLIYIFAFEFRLIRYHCTNCYYYGKTCGFGKGRISSWFFKKGNPANFCSKNMTWKDIIPDMLISLIPFVVGIVLLIIDFNFFILAGLIIILVLTTNGNGFVREKVTCNHCKQRELGCPADSLFNKEKQEKT
ncbi:MAG: hypothetical protein K9H26_12105 [Prolixibacteraceae bacterium]|nr:hypothetical protein [Prolixibacteraceae bacterium]